MAIESRFVALSWRLVGPFGDGAPRVPLERTGRMPVNATFLEMGIDQACEALIAWHGENVAGDSAGKLDYEIAERPFPAARVAIARQTALRLGLTPEREIARWRMALALPEFTRMAVRTPGLQEIFREVADVGWMQALRTGGRPKFKVLPLTRGVSKAAQSVPAQYNLPVLLQIDGEPVLVMRLIATESKSPVSCLAGIIGLQAARVRGDGGELTVRLVAAISAERTARFP